MVSFTNIVETQDAGLGIVRGLRFIASARRRRYGKTDRIPGALRWSPAATARITKIAEGLKDVLTWRLLLVSRRSAVAVPATAQRQTRGMRPVAVLDFLYRHEIWAGQTRFLSARIRESPL